MTAAELHRCLRESLKAFDPEREGQALRLLLEQGSAEHFLVDLLFIRLHADGHMVSREFPVGERCASDLALHGSVTLHIEAKQLHLKDGCRYAPPNLAKDLSRYGASPCLGILYLLDERASRSSLALPRFAGANRRARHEPASVVAELPTFFGTVFPASLEDALLREFAGDGGVRLYGFVVGL